MNGIWLFLDVTPFEPRAAAIARPNDARFLLDGTNPRYPAGAMPYSVRCKACSAVFAIPDDIWNRRVRGRMATLKCRSCKGDIQVDGTKADAGVLSEAPKSSPSAPTASAPEAPAAASPVASRPAVEPPVASRPAVEPPVASRPAVEPPVASRPAVEPPVASRPAVEPPVALAPPSSVKPGLKPKAVAPSEIAAAETGWSLMPPPAELVEIKAPKPAATPATAVLVTTTPEKAAPDTVTEPSPQPEVIADLWVVSYGEDDDRELTEKQIAAELSRGKINATTIVWREEMPEWLPISGVVELAKYLPTPKPRATITKSTTNTAKTATAKTTTVKGATAKPVTTSPTPTQKQENKPLVQPKSTTATTAVSATKAPAVASTVPRQPPAREKQPSTPHVGPSVPQAEKQALAKQTSPAAKSPPPLTRPTQKSAEKLSSSTDGIPRVLQPSGGKTPGHTSHTAKSEATETSVPWRKAQESADEEVLTSAPLIDQVSSPEPPSPAQITAPPATAEQPSPHPVESSIAVTAPAAPATFPAASTTSEPRVIPSHPSTRASFRPPKPVETATALVVHTEHAPSAGVLEITDDDFLAMQRRFPKWALPAAIGGAAILLGLIIYAATSGDEPPPLPVAPVIVPSNVSPIGEGNRRPQPDLNNLPTTSGASKSNNGESDFASAFAKAAGKSTGNFDAKAAERQASAAIERASKCRAANDPPGLVNAVVSIAPSGQVTSVQVSPPHGTLATGKCVDKALRGFTVKPFQGETAKLPLSFNLR